MASWMNKKQFSAWTFLVRAFHNFHTNGWMWIICANRKSIHQNARTNDVVLLQNIYINENRQHNGNGNALAIKNRTMIHVENRFSHLIHLTNRIICYRFFLLVAVLYIPNLVHQKAIVGKLNPLACGSAHPCPSSFSISRPRWRWKAMDCECQTVSDRWIKREQNG